jgi:asparagine synthase (glutamine-hydrolysing)
VQTTYWSLADVQARGATQLRDIDDASAVEAFESLLLDAVGRRMVADVPLGAFLSSGIDSSLVVALMQQVSSSPVKTFTIGFGPREFDEAPYAPTIAEVLGTEHTALYVEPQQAWDVIPKLPDIYDEPFADSSQIPTFLISELTRGQVTVSLSGDGGGELCAGYERYEFTNMLARKLGRVPTFARARIGRLIHRFSPAQWDRLSRIALLGIRYPRFGDCLHNLATAVPQSDDGALYRQLISQWESPSDVVQGVHEHQGVLWDEDIGEAIPDFVERMQYLDMLT